MKKIIFTTSLCCIPLLSAADGIEKIKCPSVQAIKSIGIDYVVAALDNPNNWAGAQKKHAFDTDIDWTFTIQAVIADSAESAHAQLTQGLSTLMLEQGPIINDNGTYYCSYRNEMSSFTAFAVSPPLQF
jgi:hypothetical protein